MLHVIGIIIAFLLGVMIKNNTDYPVKKKTLKEPLSIGGGFILKKDIIMKKFILILLIFTLAAHSSNAAAAIYSFQPSDPDLDDLEHGTAYEWGIELNLSDDEVITGASIFFDNIRNFNSGTNDLFVTLLNGSPLGLTPFSDNQYPAENFFTTNRPGGIEIVRYRNLPAYEQDITYIFDATQLSDLYSYLIDDGSFGLGFDPDCHFYNDGITLTITTDIHAPIPSAIFLFGIGLLGLTGVSRRKR